MAKKLFFVTGNKNKLSELERFIAQQPGLKENIQVEGVKIDLPELQGNAKEVIDAKLDEAIKHIKDGAVLVDDTGLCLEALNGLPGVYIKHFLEAIGSQGIVNMLEAFPNKKSTAECHLGFYDFGFTSQPKKIHVRGVCDGTIVQPRGSNGFGFDPIFEENTSKTTLAEMSPEVKNKLSHRANALEQLCDLLAKYL